MMRKLILSVLVLLQLNYSCKYSTENKLVIDKEINKLEWLIGTWENMNEESEFYEFWQKENDTIYYGESYLVKNQDTLFSETMLLKQTKDNLFLIPTTKNQNDGNPVIFKLVSTDNNIFVFENKEHDFPQRIVYTNSKPDSLHAYIEGEDMGNYKKIDFKFIKRR